MQLPTCPKAKYYPKQCEGTLQKLKNEGLGPFLHNNLLLSTLSNKSSQDWDEAMAM